MSTEDDNNKDGAAEDPFAGWAEALEEQKASDDKPGDAEQGGPLTGDPVRPSSSSNSDGTVNDINMVLDIPVQLSVELGRTKVPIKYILQLAQGSVVELDALAGEPMDVLVNGYLIAQGEVVVVNDKFGIRLTDVVTPSERLRRVSRG
ncbi:flagellar motor switch protein FliN [Acidovorax sp.]|jgi:flagellar motor switch protein FliN/FliY|uniref:flagellar motor switch protein FliN n=1 Tax=Acidovorax sp. TaxID=1872122 RepID=UPI00391F2CD1